MSDLLKRKWNRAGMFREYENVVYDPSRGNEEGWSVVHDYIANLDMFREAGRGILIQGPPALGKTLAAHLVGRAVLEKGYSLYCLELATLTQLMQRQQTLQTNVAKLGDTDSFEEWRRNDRLVQDIRKYFDWVILDDVGKEYSSGSGWTESLFDWILRFRYNRGRPTILTSNVPVEQWEVKYNVSMASFIHGSCVIAEFTEEDCRARR